MSPMLKMGAIAFVAGMCGGILSAMIFQKPAPQNAALPAVTRAVASGSSKSERQVLSLAKGGEVPSVLKDCSKELYQYCAQIEPGKGALKNCLLANESSLSPSCLTAARNVKAVQQTN